MCTRFVYRGNDVITGFNFDIDPAVWNHRIIEEKDCFYIGILRPDGPWATRLSFVCSMNEQAVYYVENNDFDHVKVYRFSRP